MRNNKPLNEFDHNETDRLLCVKRVAKIVGFNPDWVYKRIAEGTFPKPIKIGRSSRWKQSSIIKWINELENN